MRGPGEKTGCKNGLLKIAARWPISATRGGDAA